MFLVMQEFFLLKVEGRQLPSFGMGHARQRWQGGAANWQPIVPHFASLGNLHACRPGLGDGNRRPVGRERPAGCYFTSPRRRRPVV